MILSIFTLFFYYKILYLRIYLCILLVILVENFGNIETIFRKFSNIWKMYSCLWANLKIDFVFYIARTLTETLSSDYHAICVAHSRGLSRIMITRTKHVFQIQPASFQISMRPSLLLVSDRLYNTAHIQPEAVLIRHCKKRIFCFKWKTVDKCLSVLLRRMIKNVLYHI